MNNPRNKKKSTGVNCNMIGIYSVLTSALEEVKELARQRRSRWIIFVYWVLLVLFQFNEPPKEKEVSSDLYVMF